MANLDNHSLVIGLLLGFASVIAADVASVVFHILRARFARCRACDWER